MSTIIQRAACLAIGLFCGLSWCHAPAEAEESVTAILRDGRTVTGAVDIRTDDERLWLRRASDGFDLASGIAWEQVLEGRTATGQLDQQQFRNWVKDVRRAGRQLAEIEPAPLNPTLGQVHSEERTTATQIPKTLLISSHLAQWDKDAQIDGLQILVTPLDEAGRLIPVDGRIDFTLVLQREHIHGNQSAARLPQFFESDRASVVVRREHFASGAAVYQLPFSKIHPDFAPTLSPHALLHARLSVPGRGVFEASDAQICLREPSWFRERLQNATHNRYLPMESNGSSNR